MFSDGATEYQYIIQDAGAAFEAVEDLGETPMDRKPVRRATCGNGTRLRV